MASQSDPEEVDEGQEEEEEEVREVAMVVGTTVPGSHWDALHGTVAFVVLQHRFYL